MISVCLPSLLPSSPSIMPLRIWMKDNMAVYVHWKLLIFYSSESFVFVFWGICNFQFVPHKTVRAKMSIEDW